MVPRLLQESWEQGKCLSRQVGGSDNAAEIAVLSRGFFPLTGGGGSTGLLKGPRGS